MLTIIQNIERFNRRYNRRRGSAMLMVLMTMAIIIVVGTSMLFVTLSSFSNSIADTQQTRAYNAALTVSDTLKNSNSLNKIIKSYESELKNSASVELKFYPDDAFDNEPLNYLTVNGVKVFVTISNASSAGKFNQVLVDVKGVKGAQESKISFFANAQASSSSMTIEETFGSSFVMNNNMGSEKTDPSVILKRIEGDVSINCFDVVDGKRVMSTRLFNPLVLEGITGSIYANGDLIIGAADNLLRVQGNIYCDGNLTIRGLDIGVNLPALKKDTYKNKYIHYFTYAKKAVGMVEVPFSSSKIEERNSGSALVGESMYEKLKDGTYRPIQVYDKISHYTLLDLAPEGATDYTFWTKNYGENSNGAYTWEEVTITLRKKDSNDNYYIVNADDEDNKQYLGASMYRDTINDGTPIMQYPQGGNIYCSGDIIFDTVNYGNVFTYDAGILNLVKDENGEDKNDGFSDITDNWNDGMLKDLAKALEGDIVNTKYDYYSLAYNLDGKGDGKIPIQTYIRGDMFCQGRVVIAPDITTSYENFKGIDKLNISDVFGSHDGYISATVFSDKGFILKDAKRFKKMVQQKWESLIGKTWGESAELGNILFDIELNRFDTHEKDKVNNGSISQRTDDLIKFIKQYKSLFEQQKASSSESVKRLLAKFNELSQYYNEFMDNQYLNFADGGKPSDYLTPKFSSTSDIYVQNNPLRKGMGESALEKAEVYAENDIYRVVKNTTDISSDGRSYSEINGIKYTAALTVKYVNIELGNVYCDGAISIVSSQIDGCFNGNSNIETDKYKNSAGIKVNGKYYGSDYIQSVLTRKSIYDLIKLVYPDNADILKNYFDIEDDKNNIEDNKNNFKGETNFSFNIGDESAYNCKEDWWYKGKHYEENITHNRKVVVLRAHYEITETVTWENSQTHTYHEAKWSGGKLIKGYFTTTEESWTHNTEYSNKKYVVDLVYCLEDNPTYQGNGYKNNKENATGKIIKSNGERVEIKDAGLTEAEKEVVKYLESHKNSLSLTCPAFVDYDSSIDFLSYFKKNHTNGFDSATYNPLDTDGADIHVLKDSVYDALEVKTHTIEYNKSATRTRTACYNFELKPFGKITGGSELGEEFSKLSFELSAESILNSTFLRTNVLLTMLSNGLHNDFNALHDNSVESTLTGVKASVSSTNSHNNYDALIRGGRAFDESAIYGMYFNNDAKYSNVYKDAYIQAVFDEINSDRFATVVESNTDTETSHNAIKDIMQGLKDSNNLVEYNTFDDYNKDGYSLANYVCSDGQIGLYKANISYSSGSAEPSNAMALMRITKAFSDGTAGWVSMKMTNEKDTSSTLRLIDFYDSNNKSGPHLRADSTFAVDRLCAKKYSVTGDYRSEVQYTINRNTYFNFEGYTNNDIVLSASPENSLRNVWDSKRMNFIIDTSKEDIYIFFNGPTTAGNEEEAKRIIFQKCTFQITGENNCYIMLVGDTSFSANAFSMELNTDGNSTDEKVGTHFISSTYQKYKAKLSGDEEKWTDLNAVLDGLAVIAVPDGASDEEIGNMFIIGMGKNNVLFGRGGAVNALVYIPNGRYSNVSYGLFGFIPIANSSNNTASIVAKDIYIAGSNRGRLIFTSYDVSKIGGSKSDSAASVFDGLLNKDTVASDTEWVAGRYYYD